jgi:anaphase-promoting complex subunit 6
MAAYRRAARLFPGCHVAHLYIGMEYLRQKNFENALLQFDQAKKICSTDPNIYNEIGVAYYMMSNYDTAQENLAMALSFCKDSYSSIYESILLNLAHCHRKQK